MVGIDTAGGAVNRERVSPEMLSPAGEEDHEALVAAKQRLEEERAQLDKLEAVMNPAEDPRRPGFIPSIAWLANSITRRGEGGICHITCIIAHHGQTLFV